MRAIAGQVAGITGRLLHQLLHLVFAAVVLSGAAVLALSWRLSQGPLELPWLAHRMEAAANEDGGPTRLSIGRLALAWNGFSRGVDHPLEIEMQDVAAIDVHGDIVARVPHASATLSLARLLVGRLAPRTLVVDGANLRALRGSDGAIRLDLGSLGENAEATEASSGQAAADSGDDWVPRMMLQLSRPPRSDLRGGGSFWSQLLTVRVDAAAATIIDRQLGLTWEFPRVAIAFARLRQGGVEGTADIDGRVGGALLHLTARASLPAGGTSTALQIQLGEIVPAKLAGAAPSLAGLAKIGLPVTLSANAELGVDLQPRHVHAEARLGQGAVAVGEGQFPILKAVLHADGTRDAVDLTLDRMEVAPPSGKPVSVLHGHAEARRETGMVQVGVGLDVDALAFADLSDIWPTGVGGRGTKPWLTQNITAGVARNAHVDMVLQTPPDFSTVDLVALSGGMEGHDLTVHWLRPVPPLEHGEARLTFEGPDVIDIAVASARQAGGAQGGIAVRQGRVRLSGLTARDQIADIEANISGPLADALAVLKHPRLKLLAKPPVELRDPGGQMTGHLTLAHLPLEFNVGLDDIGITATAHLVDVHLGGTVAGRDVDRGVLDVEVSNDALKIAGQAEVGKIPTQALVEMDFRPGPAAQIVQKVSASANLDARQLPGLGVDAGEAIGGIAAIQAMVQTRRDGRGDITLKADLARTRLQLPRLNWVKTPDQPATAEVHLLLDHDRMSGIDRLRVQGDGIDVSGQVDFTAGKPSGLRLPRIVLGQAIDAAGELRFPAGPGAPWVVNVSGALIDLTSRKTRAERVKPREGDDAPTPPYLADARFGRVVFGSGRALAGVVLHAESDGRILTSARLTGSSGGAFEIVIAPAAQGRTLAATADDAGGLLRAVDLFDEMQGGHLKLSGSFNDATSRHALSGTAEISAFSLTHEPVVAKILQGVTLYGLVDAIQGPGLGFDRLIAPFQYSDAVITLGDARVFSSSLGMTAKGRVDTASGGCDVRGTIVPLYFFNNLLSNIPLLGRLFSPEKGGGLFAATYSVRGACSDPGVRVNPLAAVTPGFLRGLFGVFDNAGAGQRAPQPSSPGNDGGKN